MSGSIIVPVLALCRFICVSDCGALCAAGNICVSCPTTTNVIPQTTLATTTLSNTDQPTTTIPDPPTTRSDQPTTTPDQPTTTIPDQPTTTTPDQLTDLPTTEAQSASAPLQFTIMTGPMTEPMTEPWTKLPMTGSTTETKSINAHDQPTTEQPADRSRFIIITPFLSNNALPYNLYNAAFGGSIGLFMIGASLLTITILCVYMKHNRKDRPKIHAEKDACGSHQSAGYTDLRHHLSATTITVDINLPDTVHSDVQMQQSSAATIQDLTSLPGLEVLSELFEKLRSTPESARNDAAGKSVILSGSKANMNADAEAIQAEPPAATSNDLATYVHPYQADETVQPEEFSAVDQNNELCKAESSISLLKDIDVSTPPRKPSRIYNTPVVANVRELLSEKFVKRDVSRPLSTSIAAGNEMSKINTSSEPAVASWKESQPSLPDTLANAIKGSILKQRIESELIPSPQKVSKSTSNVHIKVDAGPTKSISGYEDVSGPQKNKQSAGSKSDGQNKGRSLDRLSEDTSWVHLTSRVSSDRDVSGGESRELKKDSSFELNISSRGSSVIVVGSPKQSRSVFIVGDGKGESSSSLHPMKSVRYE